MTVNHALDAAGSETLLENRTSAGVGLAIFTNFYDPAFLTLQLMGNCNCSFASLFWLGISLTIRKKLSYAGSAKNRRIIKTLLEQE